jgi:hypothetical protein
MGINSADTSQQPNEEIYMDKSLLLPNNPARQKYCYTSVPIEAAKVNLAMDDPNLDKNNGKAAVIIHHGPDPGAD